MQVRLPSGGRLKLDGHARRCRRGQGLDFGMERRPVNHDVLKTYNLK